MTAPSQPDSTPDDAAGIVGITRLLGIGGKVCKQCGETKTRSEYYTLKTGKDGLHPRCKACTAANSKAAREADPETAREKNRLRQRKWNAANPDKLRNRIERWKKAHPEQAKAIQDNWWKSNPEASKGYQKKYRENLDDSYVRKVIAAHSTLTAADIPQDLVDLMRAHIKLSRTLNDNQP